jgi:hypothetical protein
MFAMNCIVLRGLSIISVLCKNNDDGNDFLYLKEIKIRCFLTRIRDYNDGQIKEECWECLPIGTHGIPQLYHKN